MNGFRGLRGLRGVSGIKRITKGYNQGRGGGEEGALKGLRKDNMGLS